MVRGLSEKEEVLLAENNEVWGGIVSGLEYMGWKS